MNRLINKTLASASPSWLWLFLGLAVATWWAATVWHPRNNSVRENVSLRLTRASHSHESATQFRPIEQIKVGDRVATNVPEEVWETDFLHADQRYKSPEVAAHPHEYSLVKLEAIHHGTDGSVDEIHVETLQHNRWLAEHQVTVGQPAPIPFDLIEMGVSAHLNAIVTHIGPCPPLKRGSGKLVVTTIDHLSDDVRDLTLAGESGHVTTIGITGLHKVYSASKRATVCARDLEPGEKLDGSLGPVTVVNNTKRLGRERVFNLTVETDHVYRVSLLGALVHNGCNNPNGSNGTPTHQAAVKELVADFTDRYPKPDFAVTSNRSILSNTQVNRRPDAAAINLRTNKVVEVGEVARTRADGITLVTREQIKQAEYKAAGLKSTVVRLTE
jgi:hypothetical protein